MAKYESAHAQEVDRVLAAAARAGGKARNTVVTPRGEAKPVPHLTGMLIGWDAICKHLGLALPAAQALATTYGMPLRRWGGKAVCIAVADLDEWRKTKADLAIPVVVGMSAALKSLARQIGLGLLIGTYGEITGEQLHNMCERHGTEQVNKVIRTARMLVGAKTSRVR